ALEERASSLETALAELSQKTDQRFEEAERLAADREAAAADRDKEREAARLAASAEETNRLDELVMMAMNRGLFSGPKRIDPIALARLREMKAANPALDRKAAETALKAEKLAINAKEIDIVFTVKFREPLVK
ncbi:MAG: hypothetical protein Q8M76_09350, partial [Spirochaetaceae bacterium]|nr:hypothetical protein [Spirochaetaceae bacterium]